LDVDGSRGIIDSDTENPKDHLVEKVTFVADPPIPIMSYRLRYYKSGNGK
jgi:hypothetical protein